LNELTLRLAGAEEAPCATELICQLHYLKSADLAVINSVMWPNMAASGWR